MTEPSTPPRDDIVRMIRRRRHAARMSRLQATASAWSVAAAVQAAARPFPGMEGARPAVR